jgi:hypothetical protein
LRRRREESTRSPLTSRRLALECRPLRSTATCARHLPGVARQRAELRGLRVRERERALSQDGAPRTSIPTSAGAPTTPAGSHRSRARSCRPARAARRERPTSRQPSSHPMHEIEPLPVPSPRPLERVETWGDAAVWPVASWG